MSDPLGGAVSPSSAPSSMRGLTSGQNASQDDISVHFLAEREQTAEQVAAWVAEFIAGAQQSLDIAMYDFRLSPPVLAILEQALRERAEAGVAIRIAYDAGKISVPDPTAAMYPPPAGTAQLVQSLGYPNRAIGGLKLMHDKYMVRDAQLPSATVWTGSPNFTDDSWSLCENNILRLRSPEIAAAYARDFEQMWRMGTYETTGDFNTPGVELTYQGQPARVEVLFSPGCGPAIDYLIARRVATAQRHVRLCTMLINSSALIAALLDVLAAGNVAVDGVYDRTQMQGVFQDFQQVPHNRWKIGAVEHIIAAAHLVGKNSTPYSPNGVHNFMHDKILLLDDTVITGSYNFSRSAEMNAENILFVESAPLAQAYSEYIDHLKAKYGGAESGSESDGQNLG